MAIIISGIKRKNYWRLSETMLPEKDEKRPVRGAWKPELKWRFCGIAVEIVSQFVKRVVRFFKSPLVPIGINAPSAVAYQLPFLVVEFFPRTVFYHRNRTGKIIKMPSRSIVVANEPISDRTFARFGVKFVDFRIAHFFAFRNAPYRGR